MKYPDNLTQKQREELCVRERKEKMTNGLCEVCDSRPADYWVQLRGIADNGEPNEDVYGSERVCHGCLRIICPCMVPAADFAVHKPDPED